MYYIRDLGTGTTYAYETKNALLRAYLSIDPKFRNLNVTGNDVCIAMNPETYKNQVYLRRYRVFDGDMRSLDIRGWTFDPEPAKQITRSFRFSGRKNHMHRTHGASFRRNTLRNRSCRDEEYDVPRMRRKTVMSSGEAWDYYEKVGLSRVNRSRCWKDQRRTERQYEKKKRTPPRNKIRQAVHTRRNRGRTIWIR